MPNSNHLTKPIPHKHHVLASQLRTLADSLAPGDRMPSVAELMKQYGAAESTARSAVETLRQEGRIVRRRGSGTFVAERLASTGGLPVRTRHSVRKKTLLIFAPYRQIFFDHYLSHLSVRTEAANIAIVCRYANHELTLDDVLELEVLQPMGVLVMNVQLSWVAESFHARGHRAIVLGEPDAGMMPTVPHIYSDAHQGGYLATKHLLDLGHRRILYVYSGELDKLARLMRWEGHLRAMREAGLPYTTDDLSAFPSHEALHEQFRDAAFLSRLFTGPQRYTGIVGFADQYAVTVVEALKKARLSVPGDVSVVGYDHLLRGAAQWSGLDTLQTLDTVDQHLSVQVHHALSLLSLPQAEWDELPPSLPVVTPTVVVRGSCGTAPRF